MQKTAAVADAPPAQFIKFLRGEDPPCQRRRRFVESPPQRVRSRLRPRHAVHLRRNYSRALKPAPARSLVKSHIFHHLLPGTVYSDTKFTPQNMVSQYAVPTSRMYYY